MEFSLELFERLTGQGWGLTAIGGSDRMADTLKGGQGARALALRIATGTQAFEDGETPNRSGVFLAFVHSSPGIRSIRSFITPIQAVSTAWKVQAQCCAVRPPIGIRSW
jgi:hypothetical protein